MTPRRFIFVGLHDSFNIWSVSLMGKKKEQVRPYQPVNSYGVIGNCYTAVLIAPDGSIDWGCFPDFDSPAVFCRLLDAQQGGFFQISPADPTISGSQRYLRESNILRTTFTAATGTIQLTDFMPVAAVKVVRRILLSLR